MTKKINTSVLILLFITLPIASLFKILHWKFAETLLLIGLITSLTLLFICIKEVINSEKINGGKKMIWVFGLTFVSVIAMPIYILSVRKKIA